MTAKGFDHRQYLVAGVPPEHLGADVAKFMAEVDAYCEAAGITTVTLGIYAANYSAVVDTIATKTEEVYVSMTKLRSYMAQYPPGQQVNLTLRNRKNRQKGKQNG